jgi:predicted ATPase
MWVKSVTIENFKQFDRLEADFTQMDCIVGPNNSGKTTLLQALALFDFCLRECLSRRNGGPYELKRRSVAPEQFYVIPASQPADLWTDRRLISDRKPKPILIKVTLSDGRTATARVILAYNRFGVSVDVPAGERAALADLASFHVSYLPVFSMFAPLEERRTSAALSDEQARGRVSAIIRNLLLDLKSKQMDRDLVELLKRVFPDLTDLSIDFDEASDRYITVTYREEGRNRDLDLFAAGSGFHQFVYLFGFILYQQPTVVLLDEPDVHLHAKLQQALLVELRRLVDDGKQVLFATHSADMIRAVAPNEVLYLEEGRVNRLRIAYDVYDTLDKLGAIESTQLPRIQTYRRVVVVEDKSDWDLLSVFCAVSLGEAEWSRVERRLAQCYAKGCPWRQNIHLLWSQLQQLVDAPGEALRVFAIADRDYHPDPAALESELSAKNPNVWWHIWRRAEIENYLLSFDGIVRCLGAPTEQPTLWEYELRNEFDRLVESSRDAAHDRLVTAMTEHDGKIDAGEASRRAREYLNERWSAEKLALADAKETVLPGIKRWLQNKGLRRFSNVALAEVLTPADLPQEIQDLAHRLADFAGAPTRDR